jgi:hypothetical protein
MGARRGKDVEQCAEKWVPVFRNNVAINNNLERRGNPI